MLEPTKTTTYKGIKTEEGLDFLTSEPITIVVGTGLRTKTWHLPKELLLNASSFFAAALNGKFTEATSKTILLPEDIPDAFSLFARWLYVGKIGCLPKLPAVEKTLVQTCVLGDKLCCLIFRDLAMLKLIRHYSGDPIREEEILYVFDHSAQGSKLRQLMIDQFRWDLQGGWFSNSSLDDRFTEDFGPVFLEASVKADGPAIDPQRQKVRYLEVLTDTDED